MGRKRLNICLLSLTVYPDSKDGAAIFQRGIYDGLKRRGHNVHLITAKWNEDIDDPNITQIPVPQGRFFWLPTYLIAGVRHLITHDYDIIHGNGARGSLPALFSGKPYITSILDLGPFEAAFQKIPIMPVIEKLNAIRAKKIMTISKIIEKGLHYYVSSVPLTKMECMYAAIDPKFAPDPRGAKRVREKQGITGRVIFYVGRIAFYKGVEYIIAAYKQLKKNHPDYQLVIGGKPTFKMEEKYRTWKRENPDIIFPGLVPEEELPAYYTMADLFVTYSSASEGFGLTPVEAIACGTPVICSTMAAYREILQDNAVFVPPQNANALAKAIEGLLDNDAEREALVKKSMKFIERYSWDNSINRLEKAYYDYLKSRK